MSNKNIKKRTTRVFALLIGINRYQDNYLARLKGCVNDVDSMERFLRETFQNPTIKRLVNREATCKGILGAFEVMFTNNGDIGPEDVMVFYYAGHGSRVKVPNGWKTADGQDGQDGQVETICPYDQYIIPVGETTRICGIPDYKLNVLLREVSSKRNNNIIVILDCCHSGGMWRGENSSSIGQVRSIDTPNPSDEDFNQDAWLIHDGRDSELSHPGFIYPLMLSHVLLAACQPQEKAYESVLESRDQGVFTSHLVSNLYKAISKEQTTYVTLVDDLLPLEPWGKKQHPTCEGMNNKRYLFSTTSEEPMFKLTRDEFSGGTRFKVDAGGIHGADEDTEFIVHPNRGTLVVDKVRGDSCDLVFKPRDRFHILGDERALMSVGKTLNVYLGAHVDGSDVRDRFTIVTERSKAHIAVQCISGRTGDLRFESVDHGRLLQHSKLSGPVWPKDLASLLDKIAYFNFHLHRAIVAPLPDKHGYPKDSKSLHDKRGPQLLDEWDRPLRDKGGSPLHDERVRMQYDEKYRPLHDRIKLKLVQFEDWRGTRIEDKARILDENKPTSVNIPASESPTVHYGLTLENRSGHKLFPYLFYFRPLDCAITPYYTPPVSEEPPVSAWNEKFLMLGYDGDDPIKFFLPPGKSVDSTFLKLFVSTSYVDMNLANMKIDEGEDGYKRAATRVRLPPACTWDTWTFEILGCAESSRLPGRQTS